MGKTKSVFVCTACGATHPRWAGKCPDCGTWDALEESSFDKSALDDPHRGSGFVEIDAGAGGATPITEIVRGSGPAHRLATGIRELDRVLGGSGESLGLVPGSVVLVGGEPGIGKSTLMLQAAGAWASPLKMDMRDPDWTSKVLYVSSEESAEQIRLRAERLGVDDTDTLFVLADTNLARIVEQVRR